jgi:uncharacterized membrane-anchored protein
MPSKRTFLLLGVFWLLIIVGFIANKELTLRTGQEVLLKTIPVDPRDLFRGDYVILRYDLSTIDLNRLSGGSQSLKQGNVVYVTLSVGEKYATVSSVSTVQPTGGLFLKGRVKQLQWNHMTVEYGIESYFVPEGKGRTIERQLGRTMDVKVAVDASGAAVIHSLLVDDKEMAFRD